ncbi:CbiX [compost metagenome]
MDVLVAPLFLSAGYFTKKTIPSRLEGLECRYSGEALLPHPLLTDWINRQILTIMKSLTLS